MVCGSYFVNPALSGAEIRQQRIQGGLKGLKPPGHEGGLRPPCVRGKCYGKGTRRGDRGKSANRLLFRAVVEFSNFGHTIKSHDHQTTRSAVFEMITDSWGPRKKSS